MQNYSSIKSGDLASFSRRTFMSLTASGVALTLPTVVAAEQTSELPITVFDQHSVALAEPLNDYLDGSFYAVIYPSHDYDYPVHLRSLAFERQAKPSLEQQMGACVAKLRTILLQTHPDIACVECRFVLAEDGCDYLLSLTGGAA